MVKSKTYLLVTVCLAVLAGPPGTSAQTHGILAADRRSDVYLECARFFDPDSGKARLEVYYQFHTHMLRFEPGDGGFTARYETSLRVRNDRGRQVGSQTRDRRITVPTEVRARSTGDFRISQGTFWLDDGNYNVELVLRDAVAGVTVPRERNVKLKTDDFITATPRLSDIQFVLESSPVSDEPTPFDKGGVTLVPSLERYYGDKLHPNLMYYVEVYAGAQEPGPTLLETVVRNTNGRHVHRDTLTLDFSQTPVLRQHRTVTLDRIGPGTYELAITLKDSRGDKRHSVSGLFEVEFTEQALVAWDPEAAEDLLSYIALPRELKELEEASTFEERMAAIDRFWRKKDPTPGTAENEIQREFYRRVQTANRAFEHMRRPGWRTDRGIVYIKHGEPDELDDHPFNIDRHPYQIWYYYRGGQYIRLVFEDSNEDGDYRLVYPFNGLFLEPNF